MSNDNVFCLRLLPDVDLYDALSQFCVDNNIEAGYLTCAVGSIKSLRMRLADSVTIIDIVANYELLQMSGTMSKNGIHLHLMVADDKGQVLGGHLLPGCLIKTTMEIIINRISGVTFEREFDQATGYRELVIK